jgi:hypothetical protein
MDLGWAGEDRSQERERGSQGSRRPGADLLVNTLAEHQKGVNRLAVAQVGREGGREGGIRWEGSVAWEGGEGRGGHIEAGREGGRKGGRKGGSH